MKLASATILGILILGTGFYAGLICGMNKGAFNAGLEENRLAKRLLSNQALTVSPEFSEYLKGRIYYNIASKYPNNRDYLLREDWDFGEVKPSRLRPNSFAKDPTFDCSSFDEATKKLTRAERPLGSDTQDET